MKTLIITGGQVKESFLRKLLLQETFDLVVAVDHGLDACEKVGILPDYILGDFDSVSRDTLARMRGSSQVKEFQPEKDDTDTALGLELALSLKSTYIVIVGATGTRMDHVFGNIQILGQALERNVPCYLVDPYNRISLLRGQRTLKKEEQYGEYVSLFPFNGPAAGVTLKGFKYPLDKIQFPLCSTLGVSNEILSEEGFIEVSQGTLIVMESKDYE